MKVSYIVPLYNKKQYILECIDSILAEETDSIEIEVCVVDDGSSDHSLDVVLEVYGNDNRVKIDSFTKNQGKNAACNRGYQMATGELICLFGADDVVVSGRTQKMLAMYDSNLPKAIYGGVIVKNKDLDKELLRSFPSKPSQYSISMENTLQGGCILLPKILGDKIFPIPEELKFEDWWIAFILVQNNNITILKDYVTYYRIHDSNDCGFYNENGNNYINIKKDYERHLEYLDLVEKKLISCGGNLDKAKDLRRSFLNYPISNIFYIKPFDIFSIKIILFYFLGSENVYKVLYFFRKLSKNILKYK